MRRLILAMSLMSLFGAVACKDGDGEHSVSSKAELPIAEEGYCFNLYAVGGWSQARIRKVLGPPKNVVKDPKQFQKSINHEPMSRRKDNEVEQWHYLDKSGVMQTLVTFDAKGRAVRALCEWSDF